jgi:uncharacterized membrane protein YbaN (DUF454 family)
MGQVARLVLIVIGTALVILGVVGMFVPLLPTTVFLLMAAWCYARSSERFHRWLLGNRLLGSYLTNYREGRGMRVREKAVTLGLLWASIGYSLAFLGLPPWGQLVLAAIALGVTAHILMLRTYRQQRAPADPQRRDDRLGCAESRNGPLPEARPQ